VRTVSDLALVLELTRDHGRGDATLEPKFDNTWRVPSLRNVALTAPYFHNGAAATLEQAVRIMGRAQLDRTLGDAEVADLVAFLKSLTGPRPEEHAPQLPR
jgi:cytochrome c peroxidase